MVDELGPWFEHLFGLKKSDLLIGDDFTLADVGNRVQFIADYRAQLNRDGGG